jgi:hypothetical protein
MATGMSRCDGNDASCSCVSSIGVPTDSRLRQPDIGDWYTRLLSGCETTRLASTACSEQGWRSTVAKVGDSL